LKKLSWALLVIIVAIVPTACKKSGVSTPTSPAPAATATFTNVPPCQNPTTGYTCTLTSTSTPSSTATPSATWTRTLTGTPTPTPTATLTRNSTWTNTPTGSNTSTRTLTPMITSTPTVSSTWTQTQTATQTYTPTSCATLPAGVFIQSIAAVYDFDGTVYGIRQAELSVNGVAETTAGITMTGPTQTLPLASGGTTLIPCGGNTGLYGPDVTVWSYQPGQVYTYQATTSGGTVTASVTAPGIISVAADGTQVSWTVEGTADWVQVTDMSNHILWQTPCCDAVSPVMIPSSAYPATGMYYVYAQVENSAPFSGAAAGSTFRMYEYRYSPVQHN